MLQKVRVEDAFQSGISLSICLHYRRYIEPGAELAEVFQSGISLSICLHGTRQRARASKVPPSFQSGISLSICLHRMRVFKQVLGLDNEVSIRHQPEYLPSQKVLMEAQIIAATVGFNQASA